MKNIEYEEKKQLEEWTGKKYSEIIFDSDIDDWDVDTSVLNDKLGKRSDVLFVVEDTENNKFGYYFASNTGLQSDGYYTTDKDSSDGHLVFNQTCALKSSFNK